MGVDICFCIERKRWSGSWERVTSEEPGFPPWIRRYEGTELFGYDRDYPLFSVLANVRNQYGYVPIAEPRGLPADVTPSVAAEYETDDTDPACPSWVTLAELKAYDWAKFRDRFIHSSVNWPDDMIAFLDTLGTPESVRLVFWFSY